VSFKKKLSSQIDISQAFDFPFLFYFLLFFFIFSVNLKLPLDPDLGWHLRYGESVVKNRLILSQDIFTHTVLGEDVKDVEWPIETIFYLIYNSWSFLGLAIFSAFLVSLAFFIPAVFFKSSYFIKFLAVVLALLGSYQVLASGARPQSASLIFFSLLVLFLFKYRRNHRIKFIVGLPILFLIWAKSHPSFILGLAFLFLFFGIEFVFYLINDRKKIKFFPFVLIFLVFFLIADLIYQISVKFNLLELFKGLALPVNLAARSEVGMMRITISEWLPPSLVTLPAGVIFLLTVAFSVGIYTIKKMERKDFKDLIVLLFFIYFSTLSGRNLPFFFLVFMPILITNLEALSLKWKFRKTLPYLNLGAMMGLAFIIGIQLPLNYKRVLTQGASLENYCQVSFYPCKAIEFVRKQGLKGKMFNHYNYGGFLTWQLREYPVFIDGRFSGTKLFGQYEKVSTLKEDWQAVLSKYDVNWMIVPTNPLFAQLVELEGGWKKIYEDKKAMILVKKEK